MRPDKAWHSDKRGYIFPVISFLLNQNSFFVYIKHGKERTECVYIRDVTISKSHGMIILRYEAHTIR